MKKRIIINESERQEILSKHLKFGYKTINEQTVQDIQNKLNKDFGANIVADNKFGPKTATAIINALDKIKSGTVTPTNQSNTATTTNQGTTTTNQGATTTNQGTTTTNQGATGGQSDGKDSTHED